MVRLPKWDTSCILIEMESVIDITWQYFGVSLRCYVDVNRFHSQRWIGYILFVKINQIDVINQLWIEINNVI